MIGESVRIEDAGSILLLNQQSVQQQKILGVGKIVVGILL